MFAGQAPEVSGQEETCLVVSWVTRVVSWRVGGSSSVQVRDLAGRGRRKAFSGDDLIWVVAGRTVGGVAAA